MGAAGEGGAGRAPATRTPSIAGAVALALAPIAAVLATSWRRDGVFVELRGAGRVVLVSTLVAAVASVLVARARSRGAPAWIAAVVAAALPLAALAAEPVAMASVVAWVGEPRAIDAHDDAWRVFVASAGEAAVAAPWAALLGAGVLAAAALATSSAARAPTRPAPRGLAAAIGLAGALAVIVVRARAAAGPRDGVIPIVAGAIALIALLRAAVAIGEDASGRASARADDDARDVAWLGLGAIALSTLAAACRHAALAAAAIAPAGFAASRVEAARLEVRAAASAEIAIGVAAALVVAVVALALLAPRARGRRAAAAAVLAPIALPCLALPLRIAALDAEADEVRPGAPGEPVADRHVPAGTLRVDLVPAADGVSLSTATLVRVRGLDPDRWSVDEVASFGPIPPGRAIAPVVDLPYLARPSPPFAMPRDRGVRVRLPVLVVAGYPATRPAEDDLRPDPELVLHVSLLDPGRVVLAWGRARTLVAVREVASPAAIAGAVRDDWQAHGGHRDPSDRRLDVALVHHAPGAPFDDLADVVAAIAGTRRAMRQPEGGTREVAAFQSYVVPTRRAAIAHAPVDDGEGDLAGLSGPLRAAIARCAGARCARPEREDVFGIEALSACDERPCAAREVAALRVRAGEELAGLGDPDRAARAFRAAALLDPAARPGPDAPEAARAIASASRDALPAVRFGAIAVSGRLAPPLVEGALEGRAGFVRACYAAALARDPALRGRLAVRFVVDRTGQVGRVAGAGGDVKDPALVACVADALAGARLPAPEGGIATVTAPIVLAPP